MNVADGLTKSTQNMFQASNRHSVACMDALIRFIDDSRVHDAIVKSLDADSADKCTVDIYEKGFGESPTQINIDGFILDNWEEYEVGYPAKVVIKESGVYLVSGVYLLYFKPTSYGINKAIGKPCDQDGVVDASITTNINLNFGFPFESVVTTNTLEMNVWTWIRYPRLYDCGDFNAAGLIISNSLLGQFDAHITGAAQDGSNKRWIYTIEEIEKTGAGYGNWGAKSGGRTGDAYNRMEDINGASGLFGIGVDSANLVGTFDVQRIPDNVPIIVSAIRRTDNAAIEYWFSAANGIDGECE